MKKLTGMQRLSAFLASAALAVFLILMIVLTLSAHIVTVHEGFESYPMHELVVFWWDMPLRSAVMTMAAIAVCMVFHTLLEKGKKYRLTQICAVLWMIASMVWLWGVRVTPRADQLRVVEAAQLFACGDYSPMREIYFNNYSYQLGICLFFEIICRLLPTIELFEVMQMFNVVMCAAMSYIMVLYAQEVSQEKQRQELNVLYLLFLPMPLYCTYVYGTIPMMLLTACSFLCFVRYIRSGGVRNGIGFALCMGLAAVMKPNAMIPMLAMAICAILHVMNTKDKRILYYVVLMCVLCIGLPKMVTWSYELRSGCRFSGDLSMLGRLVMGFQRSSTGAGWFNNYTEQYSTWLMDPQEAKALILADLVQIFTDFARAPWTFVQFMAEKCASMWLEPTYSVLWHGAVSDVTGRYNGLGNMLYLGMLRMPVERLMDAFQQAMYVLATVGVVSSFKKRNDPVQILLSVMVLGGFLYHALFEAKSQYIFVYAFFLMPLAAQGLKVLEKWLFEKLGMNRFRIQRNKK